MACGRVSADAHRAVAGLRLRFQQHRLTEGVQRCDDHQRRDRRPAAASPGRGPARAELSQDDSVASGPVAPPARSLDESPALPETNAEVATAQPSAARDRQAVLGVPEDMDADEWADWFDTVAPEVRTARRDELMVSGLQAGLTLQAVGDRYGVSRERVRQIAAAQGVSIKELRRLQREQQERHDRRVTRHIYGTSLTYPELDIDELAEWWDVDEQTVRKALGHRLTVHETRPYEGETGRTSEENLLAALTEWGSQSSSLTGDDYTAWAAGRGLPGKQTIAIRFGSWNTALVLAGWGDHVQDRGGLRPTISDETLWSSVLDFIRADLPSYSFAAYDAYAREHGLGSGALLRQRLGSWSEVHQRIRLLLRYAADRDGSWEWAEAVLEISPRDQPRDGITEADALDSLRRVASRIVGPVTVQAYEAEREPGDAGAAMIQARCGSWIKALLSAGLDDRLSAKARGKLSRGEVQLDD